MLDLHPRAADRPERRAPAPEKEDNEREQTETQFIPRLLREGDRESSYEKQRQEAQAKKRKQPEEQVHSLAASQAFSLAELPKQVLKKIAGLLDPPTLCALSLVCRSLRSISDGSPWRAIYVQRFKSISLSILSIYYTPSVLVIP